MRMVQIILDVFKVDFPYEMMTVIVGYHCSLRSDRRTGMDSLLAFISFTQEAEEFYQVTCKLPCTIAFLEFLYFSLHI